MATASAKREDGDMQQLRSLTTSVRNAMYRAQFRLDGLRLIGPKTGPNLYELAWADTNDASRYSVQLTLEPYRGVSDDVVCGHLEVFYSGGLTLTQSNPQRRLVASYELLLLQLEDPEYLCDLIIAAAKTHHRIF
jgi:hypothetical protein